MIRQVRQALRRWRPLNSPAPLTVLFARFQNILKLNNQILEMMADMNDKSGGDYVFDRQYIRSACGDMTDLVHTLIDNFNILVQGRYRELHEPFHRISREIDGELEGRRHVPDMPFVMRYKDITVASAEVVGGKSANLAELKNKLAMPVPEGFAITLAAFQHLLDENHLSVKIAELLSGWNGGETTAMETSQRIRELILSAPVPLDMQQAIRKALSVVMKNTGNTRMGWAVRSSALGEDSEHSFAGQFKTLLNISTDGVLEAYGQILASTYSVPAMIYRREKGIKDNEVAMAVSCQQTIPALKSGVLFTLDPLAPETEQMTLSAAWGLGAPLVDGKMQADQYRIMRRYPHQIMQMEVVRKPERWAPLDGGGCAFEAVPPDRQDRPCLQEDEVLQIAQMGMKIEKYFRKPQEVEWSVDPDGNIYILQARPLNIRARISQMVCDISDVIQDHPVIFAHKGVIAQNGIAGGTTFVVRNEDDLARFPAGAILVAKQSSPKFAAVAGIVSGIITDVGSPTGHMATIVREFRIPTILNTGVATTLLTSGREITMDAEQNIVYEGIVDKLCLYEFVEDAFEETYEYRLLRRVLKRISPLSLLDPKDRNFTPRACRTYHDITRFIHEKAVAALIHLNTGPVGGKSRTSGVRLKSDIPLDLTMIDIGGGLTTDRIWAKSIEITQIQSKPMLAFLTGLQSGGVWSTDPMAVDFKGFMSSLTRTFSTHQAGPKEIGRNLAVVSAEYANINLRIGYHFNLVDAYISEQMNDNYAYFRFMGGVTDQTRRNRRTKLIAIILEQNDFMVRLRQDLVVARIKKLDSTRMAEKVVLLGRLVAFTRQLDAKMSNDGQIEHYLLKFKALTTGGPVSAT